MFDSAVAVCMNGWMSNTIVKRYKNAVHLPSLSPSPLFLPTGPMHVQPTNHLPWPKPLSIPSFSPTPSPCPAVTAPPRCLARRGLSARPGPARGRRTATCTPRTWSSAWRSRRTSGGRPTRGRLSRRGPCGWPRAPCRAPTANRTPPRTVSPEFLSFVCLWWVFDFD